jgi:uncharacterized protein YciI
MPLFLVQCTDVPGGAAIRAAHRDAHLAHVRGSGRTRLAGPVLDDADAVAGSFLVFEAADRSDAESWCAADPFRQAGVYAQVDIKPVRLTYTDLKTDGQ